MEKHTSKRDLRKNAHTASNKPPQAPNSNSFHTKKRFPKNRENASIAVIFFQKNALALKNSPKNTYIFSAFAFGMFQGVDTLRMHRNMPKACHYVMINRYI